MIHKLYHIIHDIISTRFLQSRKDDISFINPVCPEDYFDKNGQKIYFFTSIFKGIIFIIVTLEVTSSEQEVITKNQIVLHFCSPY